MNFEESVKYVENRTRKTRDKVDLSVITELLERVGNPHDSFKSIHVAGTNGKGSVCAYIDSSLRKEGYKTGLFTSPYIMVFNERIRINGKNIEDNIFAEVASNVRIHAENMISDGFPEASFFELLTAVAFIIFKKEKVDIAVIETGIGGTYDSTNVISPILSIITSIAYDHMNILGNSIDEIAQNKAGIIKPNCPVITAYQKYDEAYAVILNEAKSKNAPLFSLNKANIIINSAGFDGAAFRFTYDSISAEIQTKLIGYHQVQNASCALLALCVLSQYTNVKLKSQSILDGIKETQWLCRMEVVRKNPLIMIDGAHNEHAVSALVKSLSDFIPYGKLNIVFGVMQRKNYIPMAKQLNEIAKQIYTVTIENDESVPGDELAEALQQIDVDAVNLGCFETTLEKLIEQSNAPILICGSLHLAGIARKYLVKG